MSLGPCHHLDHDPATSGRAITSAAQQVLAELWLGLMGIGASLVWLSWSDRWRVMRHVGIMVLTIHLIATVVLVISGPAIIGVASD